MFRNADDRQNGQTLRDYDICIVGAGAAGIAIAKQLLTSSKKVLLLSSGLRTDDGAPPPPDRVSLYEGTLGPFMQKVDSRFLTRSRLRMYGGTTNHFGFWAAPLTEADLRGRPGYRDAHWPFGINELNEYYPGANTFGDYGPFNYDDIDFWAAKLHGKPFPRGSYDKLQNAIFHWQPNPDIQRFQVHYGPDLEESENVCVLFNSNVLEVHSDESRGHVHKLSCKTIDRGQAGRDFSVQLGPNGSYVLAQGGIEPVRLLQISGNLGDNQKRMLGKGFMVHPLIERAATVSFTPPVYMAVQNFFRQQNVSNPSKAQSAEEDAPIPSHVYHPEDYEKMRQFQAWGVLAPTPKAMESEKIGDFRVNLTFWGGGNEAGINFNWEQVPNEKSTITLNTDPRDRDPIFGQPTVKLDWNLVEADKRTIIKGLELCKQYLQDRGGKNFKITTDLSGGPENWTFSPGNPGGNALHPGDHHMGALRMSQDPSDGIVDENCRFHSVDNLYAAGCGVFPTSGYANPTLTLVALALRLADHLNEL